MTAGLETYNVDGSVSLAADGSYGVFTERYYIPAQNPGVTAYFSIPGSYARWQAGRMIVLRISDGNMFSYDPLPNDTIQIYTGSEQKLYVLEW